MVWQIESEPGEEDAPDDSNGDEDGDRNREKVLLTAGGIYTFDPATGMLTFNTAASQFECEGLQVRTDEQTVLLTATTLTLLEEDN